MKVFYAAAQNREVPVLAEIQNKQNREIKSWGMPLVAIRLLRPFHMTLQADVSSESSLVTDTIKFEESK